MRTRTGAAVAGPSNSIASRLRRRDSPQNPTTSRSTSHATHGRVTRRTNARVRYNYSDSEEKDDDEENESDDEIVQTPVRRAKRPHPDDHHDSSGSQPKRRQPPRRATRYSALAAENEDEAYLSPSSDETPRRRRGENKGKNKSREQRRIPARPKSSSAGSSPEKKRAVKDPPTPDTMTTTPTATAGTTTTTPKPPWSMLPYLVLCRIFALAAADLDSVDAVRQYVAASRTCRAFVEPALRALYECPPLLTMNMAHTLVDLLDTPPETTTFDYRVMVRELRIEVGSLASRVYKGRHLDIPQMVAHCPRLTDLDLYHYKDLPPYRQQSENLRWTYPPSLFATLAADSETAGADPNSPSPIRLKSWRWNQRLMGKDLTLEGIQALHLSPSFASLQTVCFVNYQRPSLYGRRAEDDPQAVAEDRQQAATFAGLLAALPALQHLVLESSTVANEYLLPQLPKTLQRLELINCLDVVTACFSEYLVTHGQQLRQLTLHHNQSLSLGFLPLLGDACPNLESLQMNLTYYNHHVFYNDSDPLYDHLLLPSEVPAWPARLATLELEHLRKWEPAAAEVFFQSLVDSAAQLPRLRVLAIKAMLDIPWRQRCALRDRWEATLARVFQRPRSEPEPAGSLQYYEEKAAAAAETTATSTSPARAKTSRREVDLTPQRRSCRLALNASETSSRASSTARGLRKAQRGAISYREPDSDEDIDFSEEEGEEEKEEERKEKEEEKKETPLFIHGMCNVVDIRIDNQKPREIQYHMDDFLDGEESNSDNEWTGDEVEVQEYAW